MDLRVNGNGSIRTLIRLANIRQLNEQEANSIEVKLDTGKG